MGAQFGSQMSLADGMRVTFVLEHDAMFVAYDTHGLLSGTCVRHRILGIICDPFSE